MARFRILNGTVLKLFAALCMLIDHVGLMFFPQHTVFRIIGRLAFPIFAFMIAEGAKYTRSRLKYFLTMLSLSIVCQVVFYVFSRSLMMCVFVTFTLSILLIYALELFKKHLFDQTGTGGKIVSFILLSGLIALIAILNYHPFFTDTLKMSFDGGLAGCIAPAFASIFDFSKIKVPDGLKRFDNITVRVLAFGIGLIGLIPYNAIQWVCLFAIIPLLMYSEKRGKYSLKYFFYLFYPLHLVALEGIYLLLYINR